MAKELSDFQRKNLLELIHRLESNKYKQVRGTLREITPDGALIGNCCLGVAGQILVDKGICRWGLPKTVIFDDGVEHYVEQLIEIGFDHLGYSAALSADLSLGYFGMALGCKNDDDETSQEKFWEMNDTQKASFSEIAAEMRKVFGFPPRKENAE